MGVPRRGRRAVRMAVYLFVMPTVLGLGLAGCPKKPPPNAAKWISAGRNALRDAGEVAPELRGLKSPEHINQGTLDDLLKRLPRSSGEVDDVAARLRVVAAYHTAVEAVVTKASVDQSLADLFLRTVADEGTAAVQAADRPTVADRLAAHGKTILTEAACDLAWKQLELNEKTTANQFVTQQGYTLVFDEMPNFWRLGLDDAVRAINNAAWNDLRGILNRLVYPQLVLQAVAWVKYGNGIYDKASSFVQDGSVHIPYLNNTYVTRAYIYYVRTCLKPPGG
jgi:hypothetical protein